MTQFDNLLKAAFDAGLAHYASPSGAPSFEDWRVTVSGLDLNGSTIKPGDSVQIVEHESIVESCRQFFGRTGIARASAFGSDYLHVYDPHAGGMVGAEIGNPAWPVVALRKINQ